jgi:hypothetical protein
MESETVAETVSDCVTVGFVDTVKLSDADAEKERAIDGEDEILRVSVIDRLRVKLEVRVRVAETDLDASPERLTVDESG